MRPIDADALIEDLEYDVELDARALDDTNLLLGRNREHVQFDKDCKQNAVVMLKNAPTVDAVPVIRCKDCGQREYGCSTFIDHNQIYGFCAWGWKAERKEE